MQSFAEQVSFERGLESLKSAGVFDTRWKTVPEFRSCVREGSFAVGDSIDLLTLKNNECIGSKKACRLFDGYEVTSSLVPGYSVI